MDSKTLMRCEARARILKAMAHPTRLFIIQKLAENECCVCNITDMVGADTSTVSRHLSVLKSAGLVQDDKRGLQVYYSLRCPCILDFLGCVENVLQENLKEQMEAIQ